MHAIVSTSVGSSWASCLIVVQCTSPTGAKIARTVASSWAFLTSSSDSIAAMASCSAAMPPNVSAYSSGVCRSTKTEGWHGCVTARMTSSRCARSPA